MMIEQLRRMLAYDGWANRRLLESIGQLDAPTERIVKLYAHIVASRVRWVGMIEGEDLDAMSTWPEWDMEESRERGRQADLAFVRVLDSASEDDLANNKVTYTNAKGEYLEFAWGDVLFHSINHSVHHRAQISTAVREAGGSPLWMDYIVMCKQEYQDEAQSAAGGSNE